IEEDTHVTCGGRFDDRLQKGDVHRVGLAANDHPARGERNAKHAKAARCVISDLRYRWISVVMAQYITAGTEFSSREIDAGITQRAGGAGRWKSESSIA